MIDYLIEDEWCIVENHFDPTHQLRSESIFSLGNGKMGQRANFEEHYAGPTFQGTYLAGIFYPDKTRVGWWKNGYPDYYAKVLNAINWIGINWFINDEQLDLARCGIKDFQRILHMKEGYLERSFVATLPSGFEVKVYVKRFLSLTDDDSGAIKYTVTPLSGSATIRVISSLDFDITNSDANYDEVFWKKFETLEKEPIAFCAARTKKTKFRVVAAMQNQLYNDGKASDIPETSLLKKSASHEFEVKVAKGKTLTLEKYVTIVTSLLHRDKDLWQKAENLNNSFTSNGFDKNLKAHADAWRAIWENADITIQGDVRAQQAIRFNIFQLFQTYSGKYPELNIGPKGFTGEKYGGATYWDTEAYCLPFYLSTAPEEVSRQLLSYRYEQLPQAIENAEKLGFKNGAALYPMVTMDGHESHNEWEITFEEIHRNGAIAFAIYRYIKYTGHTQYLLPQGLEVLIAISRFWAQRVNWSEYREKYVLLGVTGPNEYENNVNNNWYTNYIARWTLQYTSGILLKLIDENPEKYAAIKQKTGFSNEELAKWEAVANNLYLPQHKSRNIFLQQDGYLDKEQILAAHLTPDERPINQHWSWDRILRSDLIKQADVLQGIYFFEDHFSEQEITSNFHFYEPRTVHESSLSPCVHAILAARLNAVEMAYKFYLNTARLDLDDYNNEVHEGLHITSMAGTWMSIVEGFGGLRIKNNKVYLRPTIPESWQGYSFKIRFRNNRLKIEVTPQQIAVHNEQGGMLQIVLNGADFTIKQGEKINTSNHV